MNELSNYIGLENLMLAEITLQALLCVLYAVFLVTVLSSKKRKIHSFTFFAVRLVLILKFVAMFEQMLRIYKNYKMLLESGEVGILYLKPPLWYLVHFVTLICFYWIIRHEEDELEEKNTGEIIGKPIKENRVVKFVEKLSKK